MNMFVCSLDTLTQPVTLTQAASDCDPLSVNLWKKPDRIAPDSRDWDPTLLRGDPRIFRARKPVQSRDNIAAVRGVRSV
jgi:hypothetical protein